MNLKKFAGFAAVGVLALVPFRGHAYQYVNALVQLVQNVDEPGRNRVQVTLNHQVVPNSFGAGASFNLYTVPPGKTLVVDQIAGSCLTNSGFTSASLYTYIDNVGGAFNYIPQNEAGGGFVSQFFSERVRAFGEAGSQVVIAFSDRHAKNHYWDCSATMAGYLVDTSLRALPAVQ